jgi:hypothetical protein
MFKKQYVPMFTPPPLKRSNHVEHKVISKRDEERIKNVLNEQHKVREMLNRNLEYRNSFLRSQRIVNYQAEKSRLQGLESKVIGNLRYYAPPVKIDEFADSESRLQQIEKKMNADHPDFFNTRYF